MEDRVAGWERTVEAADLAPGGWSTESELTL